MSASHCLSCGGRDVTIERQYRHLKAQFCGTECQTAFHLAMWSPLGVRGKQTVTNDDSDSSESESESYTHSSSEDSEFEWTKLDKEYDVYELFQYGDYEALRSDTFQPLRFVADTGVAKIYARDGDEPGERAYNTDWMPFLANTVRYNGATLYGTVWLFPPGSAARFTEKQTRALKAALNKERRALKPVKPVWK
jgi:hypothetical protein